jgi:thioredoxin-like negative regulator of GroEL
MIAMNEKLYQQAMEGSKPVLLEYWAPWCVYCRRIAPAMEQLARSREDLLVGQVNIDDHPELASREQIEVIPTLVLYQGGEALGSIVAPESRSRIEEFLADYLES